MMMNDNESSVDSCSFRQNNADDKNNEISTNVGKDDVVLAKKETVSVNRMRALVAIVLFVSTIGVALTVYYYMKNSENEQFETYYKDDTAKLLEETGKAFERTISVLDMFATSLVSYARATNQTWPFVTIPDFAIKAAKMRTIMLGCGIFLTLVVDPSQRQKWNEYTWANHEKWTNETLKMQAQDANYFGNLTSLEPTPNPEIKDIFGEPVPYNVTRILLPDWQTYPLAHTGPNYNYDWLSTIDGSEVILALIENRKFGLSLTYLIPDPNDPVSVAENAEFAFWNQQFLRPEEEANEPVFDLYYPVLNKLDSIQARNPDFNLSQYDVVASVNTVIYWRDLIRNNLPPDRRGIVLVVNSSCNPSFTYMIDGPSTIYLGVGDHHETKYDHLKIESSFYDLQIYSQTDSEYSGLEMETESCAITIQAYPSSVMESDYTTHNPALFAAIAVLIFAFTSIVFLIYDFNVERRQKTVMTSAQTTSAIVSSFFPDAVRDKMIHEHQQNRQNEGKATAATTTTTQDATSTVLVDNFSSGSENPNLLSAKPIADLYPNTTVLFADISGFTKWSSSREPSQVFTLLETLFGSFDRCARIRKVFKVETVGDCYVAVCGLPEPNLNHAVSICRFAMDIIKETEKIVHQLEGTLGSGTIDLMLRVGVNSGPTIAGVLRGEKSRFQLFGDTMNTGARMESTGIPGRIQASQSTATLLIASGKEKWVTERTEVVEAKGKGLMQTYWIVPKSNPSVSIDSTNAPGSIDSTTAPVSIDSSTTGPTLSKTLLTLNDCMEQPMKTVNGE